MRASSWGPSSFPGRSPNPHNSSLPHAAQAFSPSLPACLSCLPGSLQLAGCLLGACCHRNQAQKDAAGPRKKRCTHVQSPTSPVSQPPPRERERKNISHCLPHGLHLGVPCPALVQTCITLCLDHWINPFSDIPASTQYSTEEHWIRSQT